MLGSCRGALGAEDASVVRRYQKSMSFLLLLYMALQSMVLGHLLHGTAAVVAAGAQGAALFGTLCMVGLIVQRRLRGTAAATLNARALGWGATVTLFGVTVWGFAEVFAPQALVHVPLLTVPAALVLCTVLAKLVLMCKRAL